MPPSDDTKSSRIGAEKGGPMLMGETFPGKYLKHKKDERGGPFPAERFPKGVKPEDGGQPTYFQNREEYEEWKRFHPRKGGKSNGAQDDSSGSVFEATSVRSGRSGREGPGSEARSSSQKGSVRSQRTQQFDTATQYSSRSRSTLADKTAALTLGPKPDPKDPKTTRSEMNEWDVKDRTLKNAQKQERTSGKDRDSGGSQMSRGGGSVNSYRTAETKQSTSSHGSMLTKASLKEHEEKARRNLKMAGMRIPEDELEEKPPTVEEVRRKQERRVQELRDNQPPFYGTVFPPRRHPVDQFPRLQNSEQQK